MAEGKIYDVIIIGGSYSGLSAAMTLGRSLRNVLLIDSGLPCNRQTPHSHNFLTNDGKAPKAIADAARAEVLKYDTVSILNDLAISGAAITAGSVGSETAAGTTLPDPVLQPLVAAPAGFSITTASGREFQAKKLLFASGIKDLLPEIKGFSECWGISIVHCPYCHGYEIRSKTTGIIANGDRAFHYAILVNNLTDNITILTSGKAEFSEEQRDKLNKHHIRVIETEVTEIEHERGQLKNVHFKDGSRLHFDAAYAAIPFVQHSDIPVSLGVALTEQGYIKTDNIQKTSVEGVYACGDSSSMMRSVANSVATGNIAGAMINMELSMTRF